MSDFWSQDPRLWTTDFKCHPGPPSRHRKQSWPAGVRGRLWRKNPAQHTEKEVRRLRRMDWRHLATAVTNQMRLTLQDIYQLPSIRQARADFRLWWWWVKATAVKQHSELLQPMVKVAEMIERHLAGILGHWEEGLTTAFMEGLNSLFSATKRKARGYRTTRNSITMLYLVAGKLRVPGY